MALFKARSFQTVRPSDDADWKVKYLDSLDTLERKEAEWSRQEKELLRNMSQLALVLYGQDSELDRALGRLRKLLRSRKHAGALSLAIEELHQISASKESGPKADPAAPPRDRPEAEPVLQSDLLIRIAKQLSHVSPEVSGSARAVVAAPSPERLEALVQDVATVCAKLAASRPRAHATTAEPEPETPSTPARNARAKRPGDGHDPRPTATLLLDLLARLKLPESYTERVAALREKLSGQVTPDDFPPAVSAIARLVSDVRRRLQAQRVEIEGFLLGVERRLRELSAFLRETDHRRQSSRHRVLELRDGIQGEITGLRAEFDGADTLESLKSVVDARLERLSGHVERHVVVEEEENVALKERLETLGKRLEGAERETDELRERLEAAEEAASRDGLTGLLNRAAFDSRLQQEYERWARDEAPLSLLIWDIDHFKRINDTFGHQAGDKVLKAIADLLRTNLRRTDIIARYGGEEMVALLPETPIDTASEVAEQLRGTLEDAQFRYGKELVRVTASCGVTEFEKGDTPESALKRADEALYEAKSGGRNRVVRPTS